MPLGVGGQGPTWLRLWASGAAVPPGGAPARWGRSARGLRGLSAEVLTEQGASLVCVSGAAFGNWVLRGQGAGLTP